MIPAFRRAAPLLAALVLIPLAWLSGVAAQAQELRGHGGPVRSLAVSGDGALAASGSFDQSVILWRLDAGSALAVLRFHEGAVNAVLALPDGRFASGGDDGRVLLWRVGLPEPEATLTAHAAPVSALALSPSGDVLASASWDGTARLTPLGSGVARTLEGHRGQLTGVAFLPGGAVVTAGYDMTLRIWPADGSAPMIAALPAVPNAVAVADGEIVAAMADGTLRFHDKAGVASGEVAVGNAPLIALAASPDGALVAAGGLGGQVAIVDRPSRSLRASLVGPGLPVWSLAFTPDARELLSGGADRLVRRWNARTGEHIGAVVPRAGGDLLAGLPAPNDRGARVFRACAACHALSKDDGPRAGPSLHGVMGRRIATLEGYNFSPALRGMDIVWTKDTVARLFEIGPNAMTPGTKMPEQVIISADDRRALVDWLEKVTR
jgi:cytochrome c